LVFTLGLDGTWRTTPGINFSLKLDVDARRGITGWLYTTGSDTVEGYDTAGRLQRISIRGLSQQLAYDKQGLLISVADPFGRTLGCAYDRARRVSHVEDPAGKTFSYTYDTNNNLTSVTGPESAMRRYLYEDSSRRSALTGLIDERNVRVATWTFDSRGVATAYAGAGGVGAVAVDYNFTGGISTVSTTAPDGKRQT